jgi:hypothetical protein
MDQITGARLKDNKGMACMRLNLPARGAAQEVIVVDATFVRLQLPAGPESHDELLAVLADKQHQLILFSISH